VADIRRGDPRKTLLRTRAATNFCYNLRWARRIMVRVARVSHSGWRRVFACALAYALVLQGLIFAATDIRPAVGTADSAAWAEFPLCSHSGLDPAAPQAPAQHPAGDNLCLFCCIAGAACVNSAPPGAPPYSKVEFTSVVWPLIAPRLVALVVNAKAWPRGPPAAA
jgi:hypothetical protein